LVVCVCVCVCVQSSVIDAVVDVTRERPWLLVIIAIVVIAPLFMCVIYCCVPPSSQVLTITVTVYVSSQYHTLMDQ